MSEEKKQTGPDHFRYVDSISPEGVTIVCRKYVVIRESEHCYWIVPEGSEGWARARQAATGKTFKDAKRVSKDSWRRFAYPEKEKALSSYKARKRHQIEHAELALERAKKLLLQTSRTLRQSTTNICAQAAITSNSSTGRTADGYLTTIERTADPVLGADGARHYG